MRRQQSKAVVFLTELLLALMIFALCASVCAGLFAWSHRLSEQSSALSHAVIVAQSAAEAFKKNPAPEDVARVMGGAADGGECVVYYCADWRPSGREDAAFVLRVRFRQDGALRHAGIVVAGMDGAEVYRLDAAALQR